MGWWPLQSGLLLQPHVEIELVLALGRLRQPIWDRNLWPWSFTVFENGKSSENLERNGPFSIASVEEPEQMIEICHPVGVSTGISQWMVIATLFFWKVNTYHDISNRHKYHDICSPLITPNSCLIGGFNSSEQYESQLGWHSQSSWKNNSHVPVNQIINMGKPPFSYGFPMVFLRSSHHQLSSVIFREPNQIPTLHGPPGSLSIFSLAASALGATTQTSAGRWVLPGNGPKIRKLDCLSILK